MKNLFTKVLMSIAVLMSAGIMADAQTRMTVGGTVTDAQNDTTVPGAAVMVKGSGTATVTDSDGRYSLDVQAGDILVCSCLGYAAEEVTVGTRSVIDFSLQVDSEMLEETVVVGYGTLKKSQLVGSVESVGGEVLEDRTNADITRSLQGQVPGLNIIQLDGKPTHGGQIFVRGGATSYVSQGATGGGRQNIQ